MRNRIVYLAALPVLGLIMANGAVAEEQGKDNFMKYCASCHGIDGKGKGELELKEGQQPSDLTQLSKNNNGYFPYIRIRDVIDGRADKGKLRAHYDNDMPVWGKVFTDSKGKSAGGQLHGEAVAKMRILDIVDYLVTIQDPAAEK